MQYEKIKDELPTYIITGYEKVSPYSLETKKEISTSFIKCDREHIDSLVATNTTWQSLTIFEFPQEAIIDMDQEGLAKLRASIVEEARRKNRYDLFLRLKKEFEQEEIVND